MSLPDTRRMIVDGKKIQQEIKEELKSFIKTIPIVPSLGIVLVGDDKASEKFVSLKKKFGEDIGIDVWLKILPETATQEQVELAVASLTTDGIVVQLPLPRHLDERSLLSKIPKEKDIDALNGGDFIAPVTGAIFEILHRYDIDLKDKSIVMVGEGRLVGLPTKIKLEEMGLVPDVITLDTPKSQREALLKNADIIITGAGDPHFIKTDMIKEGVVMLDAGTSEKAGKLDGDADPKCQEIASLLTPVPGGIGPVTIAILFKNLLKACKI